MYILYITLYIHDMYYIVYNIEYTKQLPALTVVSIESDDQVTYDCQEGLGLQNLNAGYKIQPKVDQSSMYDAVWKTLGEGGCIGIFPEGGSHDQTNLLPLKAGICIMSLGAAQKYRKKVRLQPVGLNYFKGHKFRSQVIVEFGVPIEITEDMVRKYTTNKRELIQEFLGNIEQRLKDVIIQAKNYQILSTLYVCRQLYVDHQRLTAQQNIELIRRFAKGFSKFDSEPECREILLQCKIYKYKLSQFGITDKQLKYMNNAGTAELLKILYHLIMAIFCFCITLPGFIMTGPIRLVLNYLAEKERQKVIPPYTHNTH